MIRRLFVLFVAKTNNVMRILSSTLRRSGTHTTPKLSEFKLKSFLSNSNSGSDSESTTMSEFKLKSFLSNSNSGSDSESTTLSEFEVSNFSSCAEETSTADTIDIENIEPSLIDIDTGSMSAGSTSASSFPAIVPNCTKIKSESRIYNSHGWILEALIKRPGHVDHCSRLHGVKPPILPATISKHWSDEISINDPNRMWVNQARLIHRYSSDAYSSIKIDSKICPVEIVYGVDLKSEYNLNTPHCYTYEALHISQRPANFTSSMLDVPIHAYRPVISKHRSGYRSNMQPVQMRLSSAKIAYHHSNNKSIINSVNMPITQALLSRHVDDHYSRSTSMILRVATAKYANSSTDNRSYVCPLDMATPAIVKEQCFANSQSEMHPLNMNTVATVQTKSIADSCSIVKDADITAVGLLRMNSHDNSASESKESNMESESISEYRAAASDIVSGHNSALSSIGFAILHENIRFVTTCFAGVSVIDNETSVMNSDVISHTESLAIIQDAEPSLYWSDPVQTESDLYITQSLSVIQNGNNIYIN